MTQSLIHLCMLPKLCDNQQFPHPVSSFVALLAIYQLYYIITNDIIDIIIIFKRVSSVLSSWDLTLYFDLSIDNFC